MRAESGRELHYVSTIDRRTGRETISKLIGDMETNLTNPSFQKQALTALSRYCSRENNRGVLKKIGEAVLDAFNTHHTNNQVCTAACLVIRHMGGNLYAFYKAGAGFYVLRAMEDFPEDAPLQSAACYAIRTLARCAYNADRLLSEKVAPLLALAMRDHPREEDVQKAVCGAVWCLCGSDQAKSLFWECNISQYVIQAMRNHPTAGKVQEYGIGALRGLGLVYSTVRIGGAEACVNALKNNLVNKRITEYCMRAIRDFCVLKSNVTVLVDLDAPKYIVNGLIQHRNILRLQDHGCSAIWTMAEQEPIRRIFIKQGVGLVFHNQLQDNSTGGEEETRMMITTLVLLSHFATSERSVRKFLSHRLVPVIVRSAQTQLALSNPSLLVVERSIDVLSAFCKTLPETTQMVATDAKYLLQEVESMNRMNKNKSAEFESLMKKVVELTNLLV